MTELEFEDALHCALVKAKTAVRLLEDAFVAETPRVQLDFAHAHLSSALIDVVQMKADL